MTTATHTLSAVSRYATDVKNGHVPAGRLVRLACERHLRDLARTDIHFDPDAAEFAVSFFTYLRHSKGEWAGDRFELADWQSFIVGCLFGWKNLDGTRRFRTGYTEIARKNGKTTLAAGIGLLLAFFDDEPGAEVYAAATKRDQAKICWNEAKAMVKASPGLASRISLLTANMHQEDTRSKFEPLGADADTTDGLNIHGAIVDELHAHKTRAMWDVIMTGTGARRQWMMFVITTAGFDRSTVCWEQHAYSEKVLTGAVEDDTWFAYIATIDACEKHLASGPAVDCEDCDDWQDPGVWVKANPNLGVSVKPEKIETAAARAAVVPGELNAFLQLHLDVWTTQSTRWLSDELWMACGTDIDMKALEGQGCFAALALNSTTDLAALSLWFPEARAALLWCWCPEDTVDARSRDDGVPYREWVRAGLLEATSGNVADYAVMRDKVNELNLTYNIREIATKRWNATQLQTQLMDDGFEVKVFGDGFKDMGPGTKELERMLIEEGMSHGGNPVYRWAASNVAVKRDHEENLRPDKEESTERIDPIEALIMAIGLSLYAEEEYAGVTFA